MNTFKTTAISLGKIFVLTVLALLLSRAFINGTKIQLVIGFFILIFITLPTIFIFYFKNNLLKKFPKIVIVWKIFRVIYVLSIIFLITMMIWGTYRLNEKEKTQNAIDFINSKKITMDDVLGKNLPPMPDKNINDSTIAGIDSNNNYIRDDVELAIFEKYPDSLKMRAAELQYAQALQLELTQVFNTETYISAIKKENLAFNCIGYAGNNVSFLVAKKISEEIKNLIFDTDLRRKTQLYNLDNYMAIYSLPHGQKCDADFLNLSN